MTSTNANGKSQTKVLLLSSLPPPAGGISTWTKTLMERGLPAPFEVDLIDTKVSRTHFTSPAVFDLGEVKRNLKIMTSAFFQLRTLQYSVLHLNCALSLKGMIRDLIITIFASYFKTPSIVHLHGLFYVPQEKDVYSRLYRWISKKMLKSAGGVITLNRPSYKSVMELGIPRHNIHITPNYVTFEDEIQPIAKHAENESQIVTFVGSLIKAKGVYTIVEVAKLIPWLEFNLIGNADRKSREELLKYIRKAGLNNQVHILGEKSHCDVIDALSKSAVFIFPSEHEGFPISVAEAMVVGLPILASPVGAIPEMIDAPKGGYLISLRDVAGYVDALKILMENPSIRTDMGKYNREKARLRFDYLAVVDQLCSIYGKAIKLQQ